MTLPKWKDVNITDGPHTLPCGCMVAIAVCDGKPNTIFKRCIPTCPNIERVLIRSEGK